MIKSAAAKYPSRLHRRKLLMIGWTPTRKGSARSLSRSGNAYACCAGQPGSRRVYRRPRARSQDSWGSLPTLSQADDLISIDTEDHLLLTRQLDDEFQLLVGRMHQLDSHIALDLGNFSAVEIATQEIEAQHVESSNQTFVDLRHESRRLS